MTKHGAPISARLITTQGQEPGVAAASIRISTDHPSTHLMVLNVSCIQAELLKPMIEWKPGGAELMGSGKKLKLERWPV